MSVARIGIAIVRKDDHVLVGMRGEGSPLAGYAEFPGGKCLADESPRACAERECLEETGLMVEATRLVDSREWTYPHGEVQLHFWECRPLADVDLQQSLHTFRWRPAADLKTLRFPEANDAVLRLLTGEGAIE